MFYPLLYLKIYIIVISKIPLLYFVYKIHCNDYGGCKYPSREYEEHIHPSKFGPTINCCDDINVKVTPYEGIKVLHFPSLGPLLTTWEHKSSP